MTAVARGFTLVEMLAALLAFSLLTAASVGILNLTLRNKEAFHRSSAAIQDIQVARAVMKADLGQLAPRAVRNAYGGQSRSSFATSSAQDKNVLVSFVRRGWNNPAGEEARSSLQYVEYILDGAELLRRTRPYLDPAPGTATITTRLLANVSSARVSFFSAGNWIDRWRAVSENAELPKAIAVTVTVAGLGEIRQAFLTPAN